MGTRGRPDPARRGGGGGGAHAFCSPTASRLYHIGGASAAHTKRTLVRKAHDPIPLGRTPFAEGTGLHPHVIAAPPGASASSSTARGARGTCRERLCTRFAPTPDSP